MLALEIGMPIEQAVARLTESGVKVGGIIRDQSSGNFAGFEDPDGNPICLCEFTSVVPESDLTSELLWWRS